MISPKVNVHYLKGRHGQTVGGAAQAPDGLEILDGASRKSLALVGPVNPSAPVFRSHRRAPPLSPTNLSSQLCILAVSTVLVYTTR